MGLIAIVLVGLGVLLGVGVLLSRADGGLHDEPMDHADLGMPDRPLTADDIAGLRFRTGLRGYRMEDVDAALERITTSLRGPAPAVVPAAASAPIASQPTTPPPTQPSAQPPNQPTTQPSAPAPPAPQPAAKPARTVRRAPKE